MNRVNSFSDSSLIHSFSSLEANKRHDCEHESDERRSLPQNKIFHMYITVSETKIIHENRRDRRRFDQQTDQRFVDTQHLHQGKVAGRPAYVVDALRYAASI